MANLIAVKSRDRFKAALTALIAAGATAAIAAPSASAVVHRVDHAGKPAHARSAQAGEYWTKARMERAQPFDVTLPETDGPASPRASSRSAGGDSTGGFNPARTIAPQLPSQDAQARAARIRAPRFSHGPVPLQWYQAYPFSANGKLFFTFRGKPYVCSATSVASKSRSTVLTAGHCVHSKKLGWAKNVAFVPAYWAGYSPYGIWPAKVATAPRGWVRQERYPFDFAALKVIRSPYGPLSRIVGGVGLSWGQPRKQQYFATGYPSNIYTGEAMYSCLSRAAGPDPFYRGPGKPSTGIGCNMKNGASGGSWVISKRNKGKRRTFINSVTSYGYGARPNLLFGPYFTKTVRNMVRSASRR